MKAGINTEKKVLIITYYWPPLGGSGVQRWLKFVKYLPEFGITPYVFTPENPSFDVRDESLERDVPMEAEVIRFPIWEPYELFFKLSGGRREKQVNTPTRLVASEKKGLLQRIATWVRGNIFIPDPRVFWVRPSVRFLSDFVKDVGIKTIITTGPPHSLHLIGYRLRKKNPSLRWVADFRDPWSEWGFLDSLGVGSFARRLHRMQERKVLEHADVITTITPFYVRRFEALSGKKVHLLTNGYDESDFENIAPEKTDHFVIRHVGIVNEKCNPRPFMEAVKQAMTDNSDFASHVRIDFVGEVHAAFREYVEADEILHAITTFTPPVPHKQLISMYNSSSVLLLVLEGYKDAEGYMPGKLFEYIATGLPVLGVGPENGDAAELLRGGQCGSMIDARNNDLVVATLQGFYQRWGQGSLISIRNVDHRFSRRTLTERLVNEIIFTNDGKDQ